MEFMLLLLLCIVQVSICADITIHNITVEYDTDIELQIDALNEYVLFFNKSGDTDPHTVKAWSANANKNFPILIVVRQAKQVSSWTIPEILETTQKDQLLQFLNTSKTLCHDDMDTVSNNPAFSIDPLTLSQTFIIGVSTSSADKVNVTIILEKENEFFIKTEKNYTELVSPSQSRYKFFKFGANDSDTVVVEVNSVDDVCLTVSVQHSKCPVLDSNKDIKYEGTYQTVNKKGAMTIAKGRYPSGFFIVFVAKPDDYECSQESSVIPVVRTVAENVNINTVVSTITFKIRNSITVQEYLIASFGTMLILAAFGLLFTGLVMLLNRFGTISRTENITLKIQDHIEPMSEEDINKLITNSELTIDSLARYPKRIKNRSFNYLSQTASISLFYSIPVIQLVVTYQRVVNLTGNQDLCYYNFLCAHPAFGFSDFNHIFSNVGYIFIGLFFIIGVLDRQRRIKITKDNGIPVHYGLYHAMGLALTIEGLLSACYHICPSQSNYQFDTSFMYIMAVLVMVKLYQNRHPDINATAYTTFSVVGIAIFIAMVGILDGTLLIWVVFLVGYAAFIVILSLKIYYLNFACSGILRFYSNLKVDGFGLKTFAPIKRGRFILIIIGNFANFSILGVGLYIYINNVTDFGTYLLGLLMANSVLHVSFYTSMKILHKEKISYESIIFGVLGLMSWITAGIFFLDAATLWTVTPAESRQWNQGCVLINFYDKHDVWHLLSAPALYFTFLYLMYLDDDLCDKPQKQIPVF